MRDTPPVFPVPVTCSNCGFITEVSYSKKAQNDGRRRNKPRHCRHCGEIICYPEDFLDASTTKQEES